MMLAVTRTWSNVSIVITWKCRSNAEILSAISRRAAGLTSVVCTVRIRKDSCLCPELTPCRLMVKLNVDRADKDSTLIHTGRLATRGQKCKDRKAVITGQSGPRTTATVTTEWASSSSVPWITGEVLTRQVPIRNISFALMARVSTITPSIMYSTCS